MQGLGSPQSPLGEGGQFVLPLFAGGQRRGGSPCTHSVRHRDRAPSRSSHSRSSSRHSSHSSNVMEGSSGPRCSLVSPPRSLRCTPHTGPLPRLQLAGHLRRLPLQPLLSPPLYHFLPLRPGLPCSSAVIAPALPDQLLLQPP